jgi:hypothetical protein
MSADRDVDRTVRAWLDLMPDEVPDRVIAAVATAVESTPQIRRPTAACGRFASMSRFSFAAVALAIVAVVAGGVTITRFNTPAVAAPTAIPPTPISDLPNSLIVLTTDASSGRIRAISPDGRIIGEVAGSTNGCRRMVLGADGRRVAFAFNGPPVTIASLDGSDRVTVRPAHGAGAGWVFSPDRTRFAYLDGTADRADLTIISLVDGTPTVIARDLQGASLFPWSSWSTDDTLAIGIHSDAESGVDVISADGTNRRRLWREPPDGRAAGDMVVVSWSPDGARLAYARGEENFPENGLPATWIIDVATGRSTLVATADGRPVNPWINSFGNGFSVTWSPDGRLVSYQVDYQQPALLDLATGESRMLPTGVDPRAWRWSPDGTRLAAHGPHDPVLTTIRADLTGRVDQVVEPDVTFAWSPDSRQIAVLSQASIDLLDPSGIERPIRISSDEALRQWGCLTWDPIITP